MNGFVGFQCKHIGLHLGKSLNYKTFYFPSIFKMPVDFREIVSYERIVFNRITLSSNFSMIFCGFVIRLTGIICVHFGLKMILFTGNFEECDYCIEKRNDIYPK